MRFAIWTYTAAIAFALLSVVVLGNLLGNIHHHRLGDMPLPRLTDWLVNFHLWASVVSLPWLAAAIWLSRHDAATPPRVIAFAGASTLALAVLLAYTTVAVVLFFVSAFRLQ